MKPHTSILLSTRSGKRWPVPRWNPSVHQGKLEPSRRRRSPWGTLRIGEPGAKAPSPPSAVLVASPLLVILHYLLKNNTAFMMGMEQVPTPPGGTQADVIAKSWVSPPEGRWGV